MPGLTHWASPRFMAFFPCDTSYPAALAEIYANAFSGAYFNWQCSPAATELETIVLDWLAKAMKLPECFLSDGHTNGGGVLHGSATESIILAMAAARHKYLSAKTAHLLDGPEKDAEQRRLSTKLVALGSSQVHSSTEKAAKIAGVTFLPVTASSKDAYSMLGLSLQDVVIRLRAKGLEPFYVTATLGTTDVCAVDDFVGIASALERCHAPGYPEIWVHVDAAYAGSALLLPEFQVWQDELSKFSSINFGPHKWMLTSIDCSAFYVKQRVDLISALDVDRAYLHNEASGRESVIDYQRWQIPLGRRFRSLKLWFVLRSYGILGLRAHLRRGIKLAESLEEMIRQRPDLFSILMPARFALLCFQANRQGDSSANERTRLLHDRVNGSGEFLLTSTVVEEAYVIRVCTGGAAVNDESILALFGVLIKEMDRIDGEGIKNCKSPECLFRSVCNASHKPESGEA